MLLNPFVQFVFERIANLTFDGYSKKACLRDRVNPYRKKHLKLSSPEDERCLLIEKSMVSYGVQLFDTSTTDIFPTQSYEFHNIKNTFSFYEFFFKTIIGTWNILKRTLSRKSNVAQTNIHTNIRSFLTSRPLSAGFVKPL